MRDAEEQLTLFGLDTWHGRMFPEPSAVQVEKTSGLSWRKSSELKTAPVQCLDLTPGHGNLLGQSYWEINSAWLGEYWTLNTGVSPSEERESSLSQILQDDPPSKYYLSRIACLGILRRAEARGKALPPQLREALMIQAEQSTSDSADTAETWAAAPDANCGTVTAFAANQRDEVRDLRDIAASLTAQPSMKQQTFVAGVTAKGNGDCFLSEERHTSLSGGGGMAGQGYPCILTAGFSAEAGAKAGSIGYHEEVAPTLKGSSSSRASVLCLNDQGGERMDLTQNKTSTLRAQMGGHQPIVCLNGQGGNVMASSEDVAGTLRAQEYGHQPLIMDEQPKTPSLFENHGIDSRCTGPHAVAPTMSARYGTGGNNVPLVAQDEAICIVGNVIGRQPQNGGNGLGCQQDIAYTLTATDQHAVFSRQRVDVFRGDSIASTQSVCQHKDATDLVVDPAVSPGNVLMPEKEAAHLIRRLTPLECERLQGFPDGWTDLPGASDSARYKALGNSVAIPCVDFVLRGIAWAINNPADIDEKERQPWNK